MAETRGLGREGLKEGLLVLLYSHQATRAIDVVVIESGALVREVYDGGVHMGRFGSGSKQYGTTSGVMKGVGEK